MEMEDDMLSVDPKKLIKADDELISYYLKMMIKNGKACPNQFLQDEDVYNKNPIEVSDLQNPSFVFVKSRTETCGKTDGCESDCWRIMARDKLIKAKKTGKILGFNKILKFCEKKKPREDDSSWVMEEYRLVKKGKEDRAVICKIQIMYKTEISILLAKHFSYLYTSSSLPNYCVETDLFLDCKCRCRQAFRVLFSDHRFYFKTL